MTQIIKLLCPHCGSDHITRDAVAKWVGAEWVLVDVHDTMTCQTCGDDFNTAREARIITSYAPAPIPWRCADWSAVTSDYDGQETDPHGYGATEEEAIEHLLEQLA